MGNTISEPMTLHLVRHAAAGDRSSWTGPDELRPLDRKGMAQALGLASLLGDRPVKRVLTSRYVRCAQTVERLAERLGIEVETHQALAEEADPEATWALLEELGGTEAVLCTHGNLVGPLLDRLHREGVERVAQDWACQKGSVWSLDPDGEGGFSRATYLPPPG